MPDATGENRRQKRMGNTKNFPVEESKCEAKASARFEGAENGICAYGFQGGCTAGGIVGRGTTAGEGFGRGVVTRPA